MAIETREKFIIQNFRSWKGKAYINLNNLTFLFGANSSGKSSLIKALGLLQQSMPTDKRSMVFADNIFDRLVPNGTNVKLGRIRSQKYRRTDDQKTIEEEIKKQEKFNPSATEPDYRIGDFLAFGWCWHHHPTFSQSSRSDNFGNALLEVFDSKLEIVFYCHPTTGENVGFEYRLGDYSAFKILKEIKYDFLDELSGKNEPRIRGVKFKVECCQEPTFWEKVFSVNGRVTSMKEHLFNEIRNFEKRNREFYFSNEEAQIIEGRIFELNDQYPRLRQQLRALVKKIRNTKDEKEKAELETSAEELDDKIDQIGEELTRYGIDPRKGAKSTRAKLKTQRNQSLIDKITRWNDIGYFLSDLNELGSFEIDASTMDLDDEEREVLHNYNIMDILNMIRIPPGPQRRLKNDPIAMFDFNRKTDFINIIAELLDTKFLDFPSMIGGLIQRFRSRIYSIHQIGPLREQPEHIPKIDIDKNVTSVGYAGENIMNVLHNLSDKNLEEINNWMENLEIGYQIETTFNTEFSIQKLILVDKNALRVSISDVGFGVTQILPIVIESVLSKGKIITIEQPELHVHPKLQSNLADLFIWSSAKNNNRFLIETHSEHIILRLQKRQREGQLPFKISSDEKNSSNWKGINHSVTINVIEKRGEPPISKIEPLGIDSKGGFKGEWPGGFFTERFSEKGLM